MDVSPSISVGPSRSPSVPKSPPPGPFSALLAPQATRTDVDSGIIDPSACLMDVEEEEPSASEATRKCVTPYGISSAVDEASVRSILQNIFLIQLHGASQSQPDYLDLEDFNALLKERDEAHQDEGHACHTNQDNLTSDLLTEVMLLMESGKITFSVCAKSMF